MSVFFCDTNSEIDKDLLQKLGINLIKMPYTVDGEEFYYDLGLNTDLPAFFERMRKGATVKTQALNPYDYTEYFEKHLANGQDILYVTFSHKMSGTFNSLNHAIAEFAQKYPERTITVCDTKNISQGAGLIVAEAAKLWKNGASDQEVAAEVERLSGMVGTYFTVENLEYLRRGGRLSKFKSFVGTLFNVKPIITTVNGALVNTETAKGRKAALKRMVEALESADFGYPVVVLQADCEADGQMIVDMIGEKYSDAKTVLHMIGPVIGCHCGPGTTGVAFINRPVPQPPTAI